MKHAASLVLTAALAWSGAQALTLTLEARVPADRLGGGLVRIEYDAGSRAVVASTRSQVYAIPVAAAAEPRLLRAVRPIRPDPDREPPEVQTVVLGDGGAFAVTGRPLDDREGTVGRWEWSFSRQGAATARVLTEAWRWANIGPGGRAVALVGKAGLTVYDAAGNRLTDVAGHQRKVALSRDGGTLLVNPADAIDAVRVVSGGTTIDVPAGAPVHGLALSPDGRRGLVWLKDGEILELDPITGALGRRVRVPAAGRPARVFISSLVLEDDGTATMGLLLGSDAGRFDHGWLARVRNGAVVWDHEHPLSRTSSSVPDVLPIGADRLAVRDLEGVSLYHVTP